MFLERFVLQVFRKSRMRARPAFSVFVIAVLKTKEKIVKRLGTLHDFGGIN